MSRTDGLWRIGAFLWAIVAAFVLQVAVVLAIIFVIIDVSKTLVLGDSWGTDNMLAEWAMRFINWPYNLLMYALFGDGEMQWLP